MSTAWVLGTMSLYRILSYLDICYSYRWTHEKRYQCLPLIPLHIAGIQRRSLDIPSGQTFKMEGFATIVHGFWLLTIIAKFSILNVFLGVCSVSVVLKIRIVLRIFFLSFAANKYY